MRKNVGDTAILLDIAPYWCRVAAISALPYYIYINIGILYESMHGGEFLVVSC